MTTMTLTGLSELPLADLKDRQRDLTNRWMDEDVADEADKANFCLNDGCDKPCVKTRCVACIDAERQAVNNELGRRNREIMGERPPVVDDVEPEEDEPAEEAATAAEDRPKCSRCGTAIRRDNKLGICRKNRDCRNEIQRLMREAKGATPRGPRTKPAKPAKLPTPRETSNIRATLEDVRQRVEQEYRHGLAAIQCIERILERMERVQ